MPDRFHRAPARGRDTRIRNRCPHAAVGLLGAAMLLASALPGCGDDAGPMDPTERASRIYAVTIRALVTDADLSAGREGPEGTVFVRSLEDEPVDVDVQVGVVNELEDWGTIRFIDEIDEAVDTDDEDTPVRDHGTLVGLGEIGEGDTRATVDAERYTGGGEVLRYEIDVERRGASWRITSPLSGSPETLPLDEG